MLVSNVVNIRDHESSDDVEVATFSTSLDALVVGGTSVRVETVLDSDADSVIDEEVRMISVVVDPETKSWIAGPTVVEQQSSSAEQP